jgi:hypothetical protein
MFQCSDLGEPIISPVEHGNFVLYVENESWQITPVDIQVYIDGRRAVAQAFPFNTWQGMNRFEFLVEEGKHTLRATSSYARDGQSVDFIRSSTPYAVVYFFPDSQPPFFQIFLYASQPTFY